MPDSTATYTALADTSAAGKLLPVDSAFVRGTLELPGTDWSLQQSGTEGNDLTSDIAVGVVILLFLLYFNKFINILPYLFGCMLRWKESVHLEDNMQIKRNRDEVTLLLAIPFCMIASKYGFIPQLASPEYGPAGRLAFTFLALLGYVLIRKLCSLAGRKIPCKKAVYATASSASRTFFSLYTVIALAVTGVMSAIGVHAGTIRTVLLYAAAGVYLIFLIRKSQIFKNSCSLFYTFLYLCILEILPTAVLMTMVMFL